MSLREKLHLPSAEGRGRFAVTAAGAAIIFGTIFIMAGNSAEKKAKEERDEAMTNVTHILTDSDTRSLGLDSLAARLQSQEREIERILRRSALRSAGQRRPWSGRVPRRGGTYPARGRAKRR